MERTALQSGFKSVDVEVGQLRDFAARYHNDSRFDFITLTNTIHEIRPSALSAVILHCLARLAPLGTLFVYDMEKLPQPELGAITWTRLEMEQVVSELCRALGIRGYVPAVGRWTHSSCIGWNVQLQRGHLGIDDEQLVGLGDSARSAMHEAIRRLLKNKLNACEAMLQSVTKYGPDTPDEGKDIIHQLYDYWALRQELDGWS